MTRENEPDRRATFVLLAVAFLLTVSPVLLFEHPKMIDYPSHLARFHLIQVLPDHPIFSRFYAVEWHLVPNLGADILALLLGKVLSPYATGRAVLIIAMTLWFAAILTLHYALWRRLSLWPAFALLFLFNANFAWGFLNYHVTMAVGVLAFAGWILLEERGWAWRLAYGVVIGLVIYTGHLIALGAYGLLVAAFELGRARAAKSDWIRDLVRRWLVAGAGFVAPALLFLSGSGASHGSLANEYNTQLTQILRTLMSATQQFSIGFDAALFLAALILILVTWRLGRWLEFSPVMAYPMLLLGAILPLVPKKLLGVFLVDIRFPFLFMILLVVSLRPVGRLPARRMVLAVAGLLLLARIGAVIVDWKRHDTEVAELRASFAKIEEGASVYPAFGHDFSHWRNFLASHHFHSASYLTIDRAIFQPLVFTGSHLLKILPEYDVMDDPQTQPANMDVLTVDFEKGPDSPERLAMRPIVSQSETVWWTHFDYLLVLFPEKPLATSLQPLLKPVHQGSFFTIYRIVRS